MSESQLVSGVKRPLDEQQEEQEEHLDKRIKTDEQQLQQQGFEEEEEEEVEVDEEEDELGDEDEEEDDEDEDDEEEVQVQEKSNEPVAEQEEVEVEVDSPVHYQHDVVAKPTTAVEEQADKKKTVQKEEMPRKMSVIRSTRSARGKNDPSKYAHLIVIYHPASGMPDLKGEIGKEIEIRVAAKYLSTKNKEVTNRQIWGTDLYTDDSDAVAILVHCGKFLLRPEPPRNISGLSVFFKVLPAEERYASSMRFKLKSRKWAAPYDRCSLKLDRISSITDNSLVDVRSNLSKTLSSDNDYPIKSKFVADFTFLFNSSFEPCLKYCLSLIGDRGMQKEEWTSWRLRKEVIYLEKGMDRYELSRIPEERSEATSEKKYDRFRWAKVLPSVMHEKQNLIPLPAAHLEVLENNLDWDEIEWGPSSVRIRGKGYDVQTLLFKQISKECIWL